MDPVALQVGTFTVAWYGVLIVGFGLVLGGGIARRLAAQRGLDIDLLDRMVFWMVFWGFVGARLIFILTSPEHFQHASLLDYVNLRRGGIGIHGGLLGGVLVLLYYARRYRLNFYRYAELMIPGVALGIVGGRMGNIMNGADIVGRVTGWPVGFVWPHAARAFHQGVCQPAFEPSLAQYCINGLMTAPVHFTQLYGVLIGLALFGASWLWLRSAQPGWAFWQFWLWYSVLRAGVEEPFRLNPLWWPVYLSEGVNNPGIGLFTLTQLVSIPIVLVALIMLVRLRRRPTRSEPASVPAQRPAS